MDELEVDKDLTKIQPKPDNTDLAYEEMMKNAEDIGSFTQPIETKKDATAAIQGLNAKQLAATSERLGGTDLKLDAFQMPGEDISSTRARNQSAGIKGLKAVGGGILTGGLIALEQLGYVADLDTYTNLFKDVEDLSGNQWTRLMRDAQEGVRESEAFKIYEDAPDDNSITSQIFKWSSLEGAVSSAVGFGLSGLGATSLVAKLGAMKKFQTLGSLVDRTLGMSAGASKAFAGPLASSMMSNYFMGQLMAADTYEQSMAALEGNIGEGEGQISRLEAQKLAANNAQEVVGLNMALTATAYLKFGAIFKRKNNFNGILKDPTTFNLTKQMIAKGSPTAFTENVYQEMIQMEQINDAQREAGMKTEYSDNYWDRMSNLALSNRALHAGALGVVGGPIQFAIIQRPLMGKQLKAQKEGYNNQQESLGWHKKLKDNNFLMFKEETKIINDAIANGKIADAETMQNLGIVNELTKAVKWGTLDYIKKDLRDIANMSEEEAIGKHKYDDTYKESAEKMLELVNKTEYYLSKVGAAPNSGEIIYNRLSRDVIQEKLIGLAADVVTARSKMEATVKEDLKALGDLKFEDDITITRDPKRLENLNPSQQAKLLNQEAKQLEELQNYKATNYEYGQFKEATNEAKKYLKLREKLDAQLVEITKEDYQRDYAKKTEKAEKTRDANLEVDKATTQEKLDADERAGFTSYAKIVADGKKMQESPEDKKERTTKWNDEVTKEKHLPKDRTFSSVDANKNLRLYTPGDMVRSADGRYFRVHAQNYSAKTDATTGKPIYRSQPHMPVLYEVDENGKSLKGDKFVLQDNDFLRPESKQALITSDGKFKGYHSDARWADYVATDSLLKPNDPEHVLRRMEKAANGEANGINISAEQLREGNYEWLNAYSHELLNNPFEGAYDVVLKMNNKGTGEKYIDVYKKVEGGKNILLTRLDREYNINYTDISDAMVKGEVTGKVTDHYSNGRNMVHELDENGLKIYHSLADARKISTKYLPNGKLIIAQTTGVYNDNAYEAIHIAQDQDGTLYDDGLVYVSEDATNPDSATIPLEIPYHAMRAGDSYMLLRAPSGQLVPIALTTDTIENLPAIDGDGTFVDTVVNSIYETINEVLKKELVEEDANDDILRQQIEDNKDIAIDNRAYMFKSKKSAVLFNKETQDDIKEHLQTTAYKHIRPSGGYYSIIGNLTNGDPIYERNAKRKKLVKENLFNVIIEVSKTTGKFVPAVEVRNPNNHAESIKYNIVDNPQEFYRKLGERRKKTSIHTLSKSSKEDMTDLIEASGMKFDISPTTPFMGSSATITLNGEDLREAGAKSAAKKGKFLKQKYGKYVEDDLRKVVEDSSEVAMQEFTNKIDNVLAFSEEGEYSLHALDIEDATTGEIKEDVTAFINSLGLKDSVTVVSEVLSAIDAEVTEDTQSSLEIAITELEAQGIIHNTEVIAKVVLALRDLQTKVNDGDHSLIYKLNRGTPAVPTGRFVQPEGYTFKLGANVYHEVYGESTIRSLSSNGMYMIKPKNKKGSKSYPVYPAETFYINGDFQKIARAKIKLAKAEKGSNIYESLEKEIKRHEATILHKAKRNNPEFDVDKGVIQSSDATLFERFSTLRAPGVTLEAVEVLGASERADKFSNALEDIVSLYEEEFSDPKKNALLASAEVVKKAHEVLNNAIVYNETELDTLAKLTNEKLKENVTPELRKHKMNFLFMKSIVTAMKDRTDITSPHTVTGEGINRKGEVKTVRVHLPSTTYFSSEGETTTTKKSSELLDVYTSVKAVVNAYTAAIASEAAIKPEIFATSKSAAKPVTNPVNKVTPTTVQDSQVAQVVKKKIRPRKRVNEPKKEDPTGENAALNNLLNVYKINPALVNAIIEKDISQEDIESFENQMRVISSMQGVDSGQVIKNFVEKHNLGKFKLKDGAKTSDDQFKFEVDQVKKMLPQVKIEVIEKTVEMVNRFGVKAVGAYDKGVRYLMNNAVTGTAYHETFHAVAGLYLTAKDRADITKEYGMDSWDAAEEQAAIDFETYARKKLQPTFGEKVKKFFDGIINWFNGTRSKDVTTAIFEKIVTQGYAKSESLNWAERSTLGIRTVEEFNNSISAENSVLLQELVKQGRIKIEC